MFKIEKNNDIYLTRGDTGRMHVKLMRMDRMYREIADGDLLTLTVREKMKSEHVLVVVHNDNISYGPSYLHIRPEDTWDIAPGHYVYDIQLNTQKGDVFTIIPPSNFFLMEGVTRP